MSLRTKLFLTVVLPLAGGLAAFGYLAAARAQSSLRSDLDTQLRDRAFLLSRMMFKQNPAVVFMNNDERLAGAAFIEQTRTVEGELAWRSSADGAPLPLSDGARRASPQDRLVFDTVNDPQRGPLRVATIGVLEFIPTDRSLRIVGFAQTALPLALADERVRSLRRWLWGVGSTALALTAGVCWLLLREWLGGFRAVTLAARQLGGDADARARLPVPEQGGELSALARDFNAVLDRLEAALAAQQRFVADASHELRTPLTILRSEIELALRRERAGEEYRETLRSAREESERLSRLVENLLALARADAGEALGARQPVNLAALAEEMCERFRALADAQGVRVTCASDGSCELPADQLAIERIATNLLENAVRHTPQGEAVEIRVRGAEKGVTLEVEDHGAGIAPEQLSRVFDRFYRIDKDRSRAHGGAGLGLSIVKSLTEAHGGFVVAKSELGRGAVFTVWLPRLRDEDRITKTSSV